MRELFFMLKHTSDWWLVISNWIFNPCAFYTQYEEEKKFQENLKAGWGKKN